MRIILITVTLIATLCGPVSLASSVPVSFGGQVVQQEFRYRPVPSVEVIQGESILLNCAVDHQSGRAQWAKNGFLLGFDRTIPGFRRYSMTGNPDEGFHNLRIEDARLDDDGDYECQIGPGMGEHGGKGISAKSHVTVLIRPHDINITNRPNGSSVEVRQDEHLNLECTVSGGKPAAQIKWFRKGVEYRSDHEEVQSTETVTSSYLAESESGYGHELTMTRSVLRLQPRSSDNGVHYTCQAFHPAIVTPMRAMVQLSVVYPPGPPEVSGYEEGDTAKMGQSLTLSCRSRGGNPLAQVIWFKNNEVIDRSFITNGRKDVVNELKIVVDPSDNNATYRCDAASSAAPKPMVASFKMTVHFAPSKVYIKGTKEARPGDTVTLICKTGRSNPASEISWVIDGRPYTVINTVTADPAGGFITQANVTFQITGQDRNTKLSSCYALNKALGETVLDTVSLNVLSPPEVPTIFGYQEASVIRAGSLQRLTCVVKGGNPLPTLRWFVGDEEIKSGISSNPNSGSVNSELAILAKDSDNGAEYRCEASNSATGDKPLISSIRLTVHYPPSMVTIKVKPKRPKAGSTVDLICESGGSNPVSDITWWRNGFLLTGQGDGVFNTTYGGQTARNILSLNVTSEDDGGVYTCQATNKLLQQSVHDATTLNVLFKPEFVSTSHRFDVIEGEGTSINVTAKGNPMEMVYKWVRKEGKQHSSNKRFTIEGSICNITNIKRSDSGVYRVEATNDEGTSETEVILNVKYSASIKKIQGYVLADQGKSAFLECQVDANPITPDMIRWRRRKNTTSDLDSDLEGSVIPLYSSLSTSASASFMPSSSSSPIIVSSTQPSSSFSPNSSSSSSSSPLSPSGEKAHIVQTLEENGSFLVINNVTRSDSGSFECVAFNGIGQAVIGTTNLLVKSKPLIDRSPIYTKAAVDSGERGQLVCRAEGAPAVSFQWTHDGQVIQHHSDTGKHLIQDTSQVDLTTYQSVLVINRVSPTDYGHYKCIARNNLGQDMVSINFTRTTKPDPPLTLKVINVTYDTVTLKWMAGFDGGLTQSYRIRFRGPTGPYMYTDVSPSNTTSFTVGSLSSSTDYSFTILSHNSFGESDYTKEVVTTATLEEPAMLGTEKVLSQVLSAGGDLKQIALVFVCGIGSSFLLVNVAFLVCVYVKKKKIKIESDEGDKGSTNKGNNGTIEMYAPTSRSDSSYHHGVMETSLSGSDEGNKSDRASSSGGHDYATDIALNNVVQSLTNGQHTYLMDDNYYSTASRFHHQPTDHLSITSMEPDLTINTYPNHIMYSNGVHHQIHPAPSSHHPQSQMMSPNNNPHLTTISGSLGDLSSNPYYPTAQGHTPVTSPTTMHHHFDYGTITYNNGGNISPVPMSPTSQTSYHSLNQIQQQQMHPSMQQPVDANTLIPPLPPLRITNSHLTSFNLPSISEEVYNGGPLPPGHLV